MILHLVNDEKVIDNTVTSFETALPGQNIFLCFLKGHPKHVSKGGNIFFIENGKVPDSVSLLNVKAIIIHYLSYDKITFIEKDNAFANIPIYWIMWGGDFYNRLLYSRGFPLYYKFHWPGLKYLVKHIFNRLGIFSRTDRFINRFIKERISYCLTTKEEFALCMKYMGSIFKNIKCIDNFFYYPIDMILGSNADKAAKGRIVLVGNSCSFTNNHLYVLKYIKHLDLTNKEIVMPLNYGGHEKYKQRIVKRGYRYFGSNFHPLLSFMPLDQYNRIMLKSEVCIYGSWRQEANGNIIIALYLGAKVFMSRKSPLFLYYTNMGLLLFPLESITQEKVDTPLSEKEKLHNRLILITRFNKDAQLNAIRKIWDVN